MSIKKQNYILKDRLDISVTAEGGTFKNSIEVDKNAVVLYAIALSSDHPELLYNRGSQKIVINDEEFFPENYESKMLFDGTGVPANERMVYLNRFYPIRGIEPGNRKVEVIYTDTANSLTVFENYRVTLYVYSLTSLFNKEEDEK